MKVSVEKLPSSEAVLEIDLTWDELEKASDKTYRKLVQKVDVPGFRRGKAPRTILERKLGKEHLYQEALDDLITETYRNALKEHDLTPIKQPELEAPVFAIGQPYHFSLKVPVITPVVLGDYRSLHFEREEASVTSEEVEQELEAMRNQQATWNAVERPAQYGDRVTVALKLTVEEQAVSDLKENPFELVQERGGLFAGMDEQVVGMSDGEQKTFTTTIPDSYSNQKLAGKEGHYDVTVQKIEIKEIPELDDALAGRVSNNQYSTLEDLRKAISDAVLTNKQNHIGSELREKAINTLVEQSQVTAHSLLIRQEAEEMLHQLSHRLEQQRLPLDQYLLMIRKTREEFLKESEPEAEKRVKRQLVLGELIKAEQIKVTSEEISALLQTYEQIGQPLPRSEEQIRSLATSYAQEKAISRLLELTTDPDPEAEKLEGEGGEEGSVANAQVAALAGEAMVTDADVVSQSEGENAEKPSNTETVPQPSSMTDETGSPEEPSGPQLAER